MTEEMRELEAQIIEATNSGQYTSEQVMRMNLLFMKVQYYNENKIEVAEAFELLEGIKNE